MTTTPIGPTEATLPGRIIFVVGESQPEQLKRLLGAYLERPQVERVVLVTATPAAASRAAAPFGAQREEGRLATVLAADDMAGALWAARRGWGEPDVVVNAG